jgi:hypothetical protein
MNNPLPPNSYTNKDFQTIYPELLETAKNLAKNWDPTIANESDPGVVLLKLNAIIGDKNNYNIDKNALENYPETYTQEVSARSQYRQLGYKMPWYRAATAPVDFKYVGEDLLDVGQYFVIPKHTMLTDSSGEYVFTLLNDTEIHKKDNYSSLIATGKVMQGSINELTIAGSNVVTLSNLDRYNRLYINDRNVAENGIFVYYDGDNSNNLWSQVYNVDIQSPGSRCYEFDVDPRTACPYIQFPNDIQSTIGDGLKVYYITTNGQSGNVAAGAIVAYLNDAVADLKSTSGISESTIKINLNTDVLVSNPYSTLDITSVDVNIGKDPETIEEARISDKRIVGTFDTLVTLRDYMNAIYNTGDVSNVVVTDRTNDIQCSYRIVSKFPSFSDTTTYLTKSVEEKLVKDALYTKGTNGLVKKSCNEDLYYVEEKDDMSPFDLKMYILQSGDIVSTATAYDNSFLIDLNQFEFYNNIDKSIPMFVIFSL